MVPTARCGSRACGLVGGGDRGVPWRDPWGPPRASGRYPQEPQWVTVSCSKFGRAFATGLTAVGDGRRVGHVVVSSVPRSLRGRTDAGHRGDRAGTLRDRHRRPTIGSDRHRSTTVSRLATGDWHCSPRRCRTAFRSGGARGHHRTGASGVHPQTSTIGSPRQRRLRGVTAAFTSSGAPSSFRRCPGRPKGHHCVAGDCAVDDLGRSYGCR